MKYGRSTARGGFTNPVCVPIVSLVGEVGHHIFRPMRLLR